MSDATILRLYAALNEADGPGAAACYAPDATFQDPAFGQLGPGEVQRMWKMLTAGGGDMSIEVTEHQSDGQTGTAHWVANYTFSQTGRPVENRIDSRFTFGADGLIADQVDTFDLKAWGAQAMGPMGKVLGTVGLLKPAVQRKARGRLAAYDG